MSFRDVIEFILREEADDKDSGVIRFDVIGPNVSDHPSDPGGLTNDGILQRVYDGYRRHHKVKLRSVRVMTAQERNAIYEEMYWIPSGADRCPFPLSLALMDYALNSGVEQAVKDLQRTLEPYSPGRVDGWFGAKTGAAVERACLHAVYRVGRMEFSGAAAVASELNDRRLLLLQKAVVKNDALAGFLLGWTRRVRRVDGEIYLHEFDRLVREAAGVCHAK